MAGEGTAPNGAAAESANADGGEAGTQETASEVNARLLAESKQNKKKAQELQARLDEVEKTKLKEQSEYKKLWETSEEKYKNLYKSLVTEKVRTAVAKEASKAGAHDVEALLMLGNKDLLVVDEESLSVDGAAEYVEDLRKSKPFLFGSQKSANINGATPGGAVKVQGQKTLKDMNSSEILAQLRSLKQ